MPRITLTYEQLDVLLRKIKDEKTNAWTPADAQRLEEIKHALEVAKVPHARLGPRVSMNKRTQ